MIGSIKGTERFVQRAIKTAIGGGGSRSIGLSDLKHPRLSGYGADKTRGRRRRMPFESNLDEAATAFPDIARKADN